jgi:hypothetical protein
MEKRMSIEEQEKIIAELNGRVKTLKMSEGLPKTVKQIDVVAFRKLAKKVAKDLEDDDILTPSS